MLTSVLRICPRNIGIVEDGNYGLTFRLSAVIVLILFSAAYCEESGGKLDVQQNDYFDSFISMFIRGTWNFCNNFLPKIFGLLPSSCPANPYTASELIDQESKLGIVNYVNDTRCLLFGFDGMPKCRISQRGPEMCNYCTLQCDNWDVKIRIFVSEPIGKDVQYACRKDRSSTTFSTYDEVKPEIRLSLSPIVCLACALPFVAVVLLVLGAFVLAKSCLSSKDGATVYCRFLTASVDNDEMMKVVYQFKDKLSSKLKQRGGFRLEKATGQPRAVNILFCFFGSRLGADVRNAIGLNRESLESNGGRSTYLVVFHHKNPTISQTFTPSVQILNKTEFWSEVDDIVDILFWVRDGVYNSATNASSLEKLATVLIKRFGGRNL